MLASTSSSAPEKSRVATGRTAKRSWVSRLWMSCGFSKPVLSSSCGGQLEVPAVDPALVVDVVEVGLDALEGLAVGAADGVGHRGHAADPDGAVVHAGGVDGDVLVDRELEHLGVGQGAVAPGRVGGGVVTGGVARVVGGVAARARRPARATPAVRRFVDGSRCPPGLGPMAWADLTPAVRTPLTLVSGRAEQGALGGRGQHVGDRVGVGGDLSGGARSRSGARSWPPGPRRRRRGRPR